jgi:TfoX/Sxy family transcriptional regulator of competence genes
MTSQQGTVEYIVEQAGAAGSVTARKMFGEYGLYCDGILVGLLCDDQWVVKPAAAGRAFVGTVEEAPPYPGAKPSLLIEGDRWDDGAFLAALIRLTAANLPRPKPKKAAATSKSAETPTP